MQKFESSRSYWLALPLALFVLAVAAPAWASETLYAQTNGVAVYQSPSPAALEITRLPAGAAVLSYGAEGEWLNVDVDVDGKSVNGWIHNSEVGTSPPG
jgi:hypothetical protein